MVRTSIRMMTAMMMAHRIADMRAPVILVPASSQVFRNRIAKQSRLATVRDLEKDGPLSKPCFRRYWKYTTMITANVGYMALEIELMRLLRPPKRK